MAPPTSSSDGAEEERDERAIDDESEDEAPPRGFFISALDANNDGVVTADQIVTCAAPRRSLADMPNRRPLKTRAWRAGVGAQNRAPRAPTPN